MPQVAKTYEGAQAMLLAANRSGASTVSSIGYNVDEIAVQKMKEWYNTYGGMSQSELGEMQLGRDFEERGGKYYFYRQFDPLDMFMKDWTPQQKHNLSVSGGSDKTTYNISLGYLNQQGILKVNTDEYDRYNFNANVNTQIRDWWSVRANVMFSRSTKSEPYQYTSGYTDVWYYLLRWPSFYPYADYQGIPFRSAMTEIAQANRESLTNNFTRVNLGTTINPIKDLAINFDYTFALLNDYQKRNGGEVGGWDMFNSSNPLTYNSSFYGATHNRVVERSRYTMSNTFKAYATYEKSFVQKHNLKVMVGMDAETREKLGHSSDRRTLVNFDKPEINLAIGDQYVDGTTYHNDFAAAGFFGRINYDYMGKYLLEVNARYDGSSKFHPDNRWGNFWSAGASWRMKEESWLADVDFLTDLKLKASYGTQGNDNIGNNTPYMDQYEVVAQDGKPGGVKVWRGNKEITWEKSNNFNIGAEFGFLDRITGSVEFFIKKTTDLLYGKPLAPSEGSPNVLWVNDMDMKNTGVEVELNANIIKSNNIKWDVSLNLTHYKNEITKLATGKDPNGYATGNIWRKKGGTIYDWYMYKYAGVDSNTGEALYYRDVTDKDGNVSTTTTANPNDATRYETGKSSLPDVYGGLSTSLTAYGFDLNINTAFSIGGYVYDSGYSSLMGGGQEGSNWSTDIFGRWTPENPQATVPRVQLSTQNLSAMSDRFLTRGDYFNIKNISLGYSFPKMYTQKLGIESLRLFAVADNVWLLSKRTGLDPRQNLDGTIDYGVYAAIRTVSFGFNINF